jgi:succinate-semialdehyde dehydrogenase/glutarate-semialdehyde dehydrogenase
MLAKMRNMGEACTAANRFLVHRSVADAFADRLAERMGGLTVGRGTEDGVQVGPLVDAKGRDKVVELVSDAVDRGASVRVGAESVDGPGYFYRPTVLTDVPLEARLTREEIFGPVAAITTFASDADAIELANRTEYGLTAAIYTRSIARGLEVARSMRTGMVHVNDTTINDQAIAPFGGWGASGNGGRFGSVANWEEFTQWQWCTVRDHAPRFAF